MDEIHEQTDPSKEGHQKHPIVKPGDLVMREVEGHIYRVRVLKGNMAQLVRSVKTGEEGTIVGDGGVFRWVDVRELKIFRTS